MNRRHLLALAVLLAAPAAAFAQASAVPTLISYQGKVTDAGGNLLGNPTPVNRVITFRVWNSPSAVAPANRLYTEQQTVTIANGEFSVLLGNGSAVPSEPNAGSLDTVFDGSTRFLGITIDDPAVTNDPEITPRQQIATTAYAFRAKVAEAVASQAVSSTMIANNAVGTAQVADAAITLGKLAANSVDSAKIADNAVGSAEIADSAVTSAKVAAGSITAAKLASDIAVWNTNGVQVFTPNGSLPNGREVGINTSTPFGPLGIWQGGAGSGENPRVHFMNSTSGQDSYVRGMYVGLAGANAYVTNFENGPVDLNTNGITRLRVTADGKVGVGTFTPQGKLTIYDGSNYASMQLQGPNSGTGAADGVQFFYDGTNNAYHRSGVWMHEYGGMDFATADVRRMRIEPDGRLGFGLDNGDSNVSFYFMGRTKTTLNGPANQHVTMRIVNPDFSEVAAFRADGIAFKPGGGSWAVSSDARLKHDVTEITDALDKFSRLRPVHFRYNDPVKYGAGERSGFIAQEMESVFPEWVSSTEDGYKAISFSGFEAYAVEAINGLRAEKDAEIAARDAKIQSLEERLAKLEAKVEALAR